MDQRSGQSGGLATNRSYGSTLLELEQSVEGACALVERLSRERGSADFDREIKRKDHEIRTERARKKRGREARQLSSRMWPRQSFAARSEQCVEVSFSGSVVASRGYWRNSRKLTANEGWEDC